MGQKKVVSAIKVWLTLFEKSYSTLCCRVLDVCFFSVHPPAFTGICDNAPHYPCDGVCGSKEDCKCNNGLIEATWGTLFNFILFSFHLLVSRNPIPLHSHAFVAMQSIIFAMGSVGQEKLACAIMVKMKHLERSYSVFCCSISDIWSFVTPPPCVHMHLWQCIPLCMRWVLWVKGSLHVQ